MKQRKHIVAATDFSDSAHDAVRWAADLAMQLGATFSVVHAFVAPHPFPVPLTAKEKAKLRAELEVSCRAIPDAVEPLLVVLDDGPAWEAIPSYAESMGADLVVVGRHGRTGPARVLLGSVAERMLRSTSVPIVVVPRATLPPAAGVTRR
jgi:nucleotide-binding universal stress UspA family protein